MAEQETVSFEDAAPVVTKALEIIKRRVGWIYPSVDFNEVLNVGYFENQKMNVNALN